jgi:hypothetical protein
MEAVLHAALEVIEATLPVLALILFFQLVVLRKVPANLRTSLLGVAMAMVGFFLFILGAKISLIPMGQEIGKYLAGGSSIFLYLFVFLLGVAVIFAEPAVRILAFEIEEVSSGSLRKRFIVPTIAFGVGIALTLAVLRITQGTNLAWLLLPGYAIALALTLVVPRKFVPIAYDAGAVATGPVAVNFVLPLATGMALGLWGEDAGVLGFGVVGLIALCPIVCMLLLGLALQRGSKHE